MFIEKNPIRRKMNCAEYRIRKNRLTIYTKLRYNVSNQTISRKKLRTCRFGHPTDRENAQMG